MTMTLPGAVAGLIEADEELAGVAAVALRRWYLENRALHPEDSAPMGLMHNGDPDWAAFSEATGGQGSNYDEQARAEWAHIRLASLVVEGLREDYEARVGLVADSLGVDRQELERWAGFCTRTPA